MKSLRIYLIPLIIIIFAVSLSMYAHTIFNQKAPTSYVVNTNGIPSTLDTKTGIVTPGVATFNLNDIAKHNNHSSCYTVVRGSVYDLTLFVTEHEGGDQPILSMCGHDGTDSFMNQHAGKQKIMRILARFKIGVLS